LLPFIQNQTPYRLNRYISRDNYWKQYVEHTNLSETDILFISLTKKGYGSLDTIKKLDTDDILKILEYESIVSDIEQLAIEDSKREN